MNMLKIATVSLTLLFTLISPIYGEGGEQKIKNLECEVTKVYSYESESKARYQVVVVDFQGSEVPIITSPLSPNYKEGDKVQVMSVEFDQEIGGDRKKFINFVVLGTSSASDIDLLLKGYGLD